MEVSLAPKADVWRGRGARRKIVPQSVKDMADSTYLTGKVYVITIDADEEEELKELLGFVHSYAKTLGRRMRVQREDDTVRFEMVDIVRRKPKEQT